MGKTIFTSLSGTSISILQPFAKILDIFISFPPSGLYNYYELTIACSPVGLIGSMDRALRPTIAKVSVWLPSTPEFCPFFFQFFFSIAQLVYITARIISSFIHCTLFWLLKMAFPQFCACDPPSSLLPSLPAINTRPWRLEETILKGRERGDECYISQKWK